MMEMNIMLSLDFLQKELAREFARRWVRDSLEEMRIEGRSEEELKNYWQLFGEDAIVLETNYCGSSELNFFIKTPATPEERDWKIIKKEAGIK